MTSGISSTETYSWIFPVNIDSIKSFTVEEVDDVGYKLVNIARIHGVSKDVVCGRLCRISPATKGHNLLGVDTEEAR
jgi:hypothetical protein